MKKINPSSSSKASNLDREPYLHLTTRGRKTGQPREIEIWFTHSNGRFYVIAEYESSHWLQNLRANGSVQVRVADRSFSARGRVVAPGAEPDLHRAIRDLSRQKYGWGDGTVVELVPE